MITLRPIQASDVLVSVIRINENSQRYGHKVGTVLGLTFSLRGMAQINCSRWPTKEAWQKSRAAIMEDVCTTLELKLTNTLRGAENYFLPDQEFCFAGPNQTHNGKDGQ